MREKTICLLLAGALALGLAACDAAAPGQTPSQPVETDVPTRPVESAPPSLALGLPPEPTAPPTAEYGLPHRDYRPWQEAYMGFLSRLQEAGMNHAWEQEAYEGLAVDERGVRADFSGYEEPVRRLSFVMSWPSEDYSLYDVDGDGVPELFVRYGTCEADFTTQCYTCRDGQVVCIGEFRSGHSALYTCPGKSAVLRHEGHMGYAQLYEYPMEGGRLTGERVLFTEEDVWDYTEPNEIVPGAEYIQSYYTQLGEYDLNKGYAPDSEWFGFDDGRPRPSAGKALVLPVCDWGVGPVVTGDSPETARAAILAALRGETGLYGISGDHFYGDVGAITWEEYIQPGAAYPYNDEPLEVAHHAWLDMNGDGQEELLLRVGEPKREDDAAARMRDTVVLSEQDGTVYAYFFGFFDDTDAFYDDGTVGQYGGNHRLSFWKDQCYEYMARRDPSARPVEWVDGPPLG